MPCNNNPEPLLEDSLINTSLATEEEKKRKEICMDVLIHCKLLVVLNLSTCCIQNSVSSKEALDLNYLEFNYNFIF